MMVAVVEDTVRRLSVLAVRNDSEAIGCVLGAGEAIQTLAVWPTWQGRRTPSVPRRGTSVRGRKGRSSTPWAAKRGKSSAPRPSVPDAK